MNLATRLLKEFWIPSLVAIGWTAYNIAVATTWDIKTLINIFGPSFFLASWATGQFFRVQKQAKIEKNLTSIEGRVESLVTRLEQHTKDFMGYTTGSDSVAHFMPMITGQGIVELGLLNNSTYPVFDIQAEVIDLDEPIDPAKGKLWTRHRYAVESLYPSKIIMGAYRFDISHRDRLNVNIFIQTRSQGLIQQLRIAKLTDGIAIAIKTTVGEKIIERTVPKNFPGFNPDDLDSVFK